MASELIDRKLYNGKYHMVHNPNAKGSAPRYKLLDGDGKIAGKPKGVTTILHKVMGVDFSGWALDEMEAHLLEKLPVITKEDLAEAKQASGKKRDKGASTGTEAHALVEAFLKEQEPDLDKASEEAVKAFSGFEKWFNAQGVEALRVEDVIYSEAFDYAGTYDGLFSIGGQVVLGDFKTTNPSREAPRGVYADMFAQLGGYAQAYNEQRWYEELNGGTELQPIEDLVVLSGKKNGRFDAVYASELGLSVKDCEQMFLRIVNLYRFRTTTTKLLGGK